MGSASIGCVCKMVVGICQIYVQVPSSSSLKDKRRVINSVIARLRNEYNVSVAEVDQQDSWQLATIAVACVSSSTEYAQGLLQRVVTSVEAGRFDLVVLDYETEII